MGYVSLTCLSFTLPPMGIFVSQPPRSSKGTSLLPADSTGVRNGGSVNTSTPAPTLPGTSAFPSKANEFKNEATTPPAELDTSGTLSPNNPRNPSSLSPGTAPY